MADKKMAMDLIKSGALKELRFIEVGIKAKVEFMTASLKDEFIIGRLK